MSKTIRFNTGRKYNIHGQQITATLHDDNTVTFMDHSRGIYGEFQLSQHCSFNEIEVMHWYDADKYKSSIRAYEDGMMKTGCNSKA